MLNIPLQAFTMLNKMTPVHVRACTDVFEKSKY